MNRFHIPLKWSLAILCCYTIILSIIITKTITKDVDAETNTPDLTLEELL